MSKPCIYVFSQTMIGLLSFGSITHYLTLCAVPVAGPLKLSEPVITPGQLALECQPSQS